MRHIPAVQRLKNDSMKRALELTELGQALELGLKQENVTLLKYTHRTYADRKVCDLLKTLFI